MLSSVGKNVSSTHSNNPYFDGVLSPITTQGEITYNCRVENAEIVRRKANMVRDAGRAGSYPGGDVDDNLHVMPNELVFGWVHKQGRSHVPGYPSHIGFSSRNGVRHAAFNSDAERMQLALRFIGLAKTPYVIDSPSQLKHGFASIAVGSGTTFHTGTQDVYPGQLLQWSVVPVDAGPINGANPGTALTNRAGTPKGKLRFRIDPVDKFNMAPSLNTALRMLTQPSSQGGVSDRTLEQMLDPDAQGPTGKPMSALQEYAVALYHVRVVQGIRAAKVLLAEFQNGNLDPREDESEIAKKIGLFADRIETNKKAWEMMRAMYSGQRSINPDGLKDVLRQNVPSAFDGNRLRNDKTAGSQYMRIVLNAGAIEARAYAMAFSEQARRVFAKASSFSRPGQRLDLVIGHFLLGC